MGLDNDTRGWIMTAVSGIGTDSYIKACTIPLTSRSVLLWRQYHMYRHYCEAIPSNA